MIGFIFRHPIAVFWAVLIHMVLFALLVIVPNNRADIIKVNLVSKVDKADKTELIKQRQPMKTFAVDSEQVILQLAKITQQEETKLQQYKQLEKQSDTERKRLAIIKQEQKVAQKKLVQQQKNAEEAKQKAKVEQQKSEQAKRLAKIEKQKQIAQKKLTLEEKKKADKAKKETKLAEKKQQEAKNKAAEAKKEREKEELKAKQIALEVKKRSAEKKKLEAETLQVRLAKEQQEEEALLQKQLAEEDAEERRRAKVKEMQDLKSVYVSNISSTVRSNWRTRARISDKAECTLSITQTPEGKVTSVKVHSCNKFASDIFKKDAEKAVYRSQPLPKPPVEELFDRNINFIFKP